MYDIIIVGGGPAGLTAGLYAGRSELKTLIIEKEVAGGQISSTAFVENYPGSIEEATGMGLSERMKAQAEKFAEIVYEDVEEVDLEGKVKKVKTKENTYEAKVIILATGAAKRKLGAKGEEEFSGRGVSYCATCDGPFYSGLEIFVVGGGEAALEEALYLTKFGKKVHIIHRRDQFRASQFVVDQCKENDKIDFILDSVLEEVKGDKEVNEVVIKNVKTGEVTNLKADVSDGAFGVFIFVGSLPQTGLFEGKLDMENGYILTDEDMKTNIEGVFACGDTRKKKIRQLVTATSDGCIAALSANKYLQGESR